MELDGIFLDMYGTIAAGDRAAVEATCAQIIADTGVPLSAHELAVTWGERFFHAMDFANHDHFETLFAVEARTLRETMSALGVTVDPEPYALRLKQYWCAPPLHPEAHEFFATIATPVCIVSNADRADLAAALARHQLTVHAVVTSEDARAYKPDPAIFTHALRLTGWRRERVIHVGDSLHSDVGGALLAGICSGWVNRAHRIHDIGEHQPDHEFTDLLGLRALLAADR